VLADQFGGLTYTESCERNGTTPQAFGNLTARHPKAWKLCQQEIQESVLSNIALNAWISRSLVSDAGPFAVRVLYDLITDPRIKPETRRLAAKDILMLQDVAGTAHLGSRLEEAAAKFADMADVIADTVEESRIVDAVEVKENVD
jgi:hypothetical protein